MRSYTTEELTVLSMLQRANDIVDLLRRAVALGFSVNFTPDQLKLVVAMLEEAVLKKVPAVGGDQ